MGRNIEETNKTIDTTASTIATEPDVKPNEQISSEEFKISGDLLVGKIKELIHEGNIRRIIIKNEEGNTLMEIPMTVGVIGGVVSAAFFPLIAAIGVIGAMVAHLTLVIERQESDEPQDDHKN
ncbi:MAG: DUF4342 domain-containing protein [Richelia sp.]|nr:DUF4342 domain-containing protein [Richelia sp.]CDN10312.1 hypothetical protein RintRC_1434 [Richelia intracellularis]